MKKEQLKSTLTLKFQSGKIDITIISKEKLEEVGISDTNNNVIDNQRLRFSSLGAYVTLLNDSQDIISVNTSSIEITSLKLDRISMIIKGLAELYPELLVFTGELSTNTHLIKDKLPEQFFHDLSVPNSYQTDIIQLKKVNNINHIYQCYKDVLHIKQVLKLNDKCSIKNLSLESFNYSIEQANLDNFIKQKIDTHE